MSEQRRDTAGRASLAWIGEGPGGVVLLTALVVGTSYVLQRDLFIGLADEGYLWYGTWRTGLGEVPLRDFHSYDPGRYYWGALFATVFGDGLLGLRASNQLFAWVGLSFGALVLRRLDRDLLFLLPASLVLYVWMYPRQKLFEPAAAMIATWAVVSLLASPRVARHFTSGLAVGAIACIGRNHGGYALVALALAIFFAWWQQPGAIVKRLAAAACGIAVGYLPVVCMIALVPGFGNAFVDSALQLVQAGTTNLTRPIPWLFSVIASPESFAGYEGTEGFSLAIVAVLYTAWPVLVVAVLGLAVARRGAQTAAAAVLLGGAIVALPYFHFAASRAGLSHLAQASPPLLTVLIALPFALAGGPGHGAPGRRRTLARGFGIAWCIVLAFGSFASVGRVTPWATMRAIGAEGLVAQEVAGEPIRMPRSTALVFETLSRLRDDHLEPDDEILVVPIMPTFYAALGRRAPIREIWFTLPTPEARQREIVAELERKRVRFVIHCDVKIDGHDDWRFRRAQPLVWRYIDERFDRANFGTLGRGCMLLERAGS